MKFTARAAYIRSQLSNPEYDWTTAMIEDQIKQASAFGVKSIYVPFQLPNEIWQELFEAGYGLFNHHQGTIIFWSESK